MTAESGCCRTLRPHTLEGAPTGLNLLARSTSWGRLLPFLFLFYLSRPLPAPQHVRKNAIRLSPCNERARSWDIRSCTRRNGTYGSCGSGRCSKCTGVGCNSRMRRLDCPHLSRLARWYSNTSYTSHDKSPPRGRRRGFRRGELSRLL